MEIVTWTIAAAARVNEVARCAPEKGRGRAAATTGAVSNRQKESGFANGTRARVLERQGSGFCSSRSHTENSNYLSLSPDVPPHARRARSTSGNYQPDGRPTRHAWSPQRHVRLEDIKFLERLTTRRIVPGNSAQRTA